MTTHIFAEFHCIIPGAFGILVENIGISIKEACAQPVLPETGIECTAEGVPGSRERYVFHHLLRSESRELRAVSKLTVIVGTPGPQTAVAFQRSHEIQSDSYGNYVIHNLLRCFCPIDIITNSELPVGIVPPGPQAPILADGSVFRFPGGS